jgi:uncharacterized membrane protein YvbJ
MFCTNCGKKILPNAKYCSHCGSYAKKSSDEFEAQETVDDVTAINNELVYYAKKAANKMMWTGIGWIIGGIVLTLLTGGFLIFWGAPLYGIYAFFKGAYYRANPNGLVKKAMRENSEN